MTFSFGVFLEGIRDCDGSVTKILAVHCFNGSIRSIKTGKVDEGITLGVACVWVSHDFWSLKDHSKGTECVIEQFLINLRIQISNEDVCSNIQVFIVGRCFIHSYRFSIQFYHVHNFYSIVCIFFT